MSLGTKRWGALAVVEGATGLLLMWFGAPGLPEPAEINAAAHDQAVRYEPKQNAPRTNADQGDALSPMQEAMARQLAQARDDVYEQWRDHRQPREIYAGRIAFFAGLFLVFVAGVQLYLVTPDSVHKW
ncbi:MAG TPA: hypothetical protein VMS17_25770 [Gemmataceae bacterium]|nr:hypothetical protein [Gemmataceae bacterium]